MQHSVKISPTPSSLPEGANFLNDALLPPEVKFTPQNLQLLFFFGMSIFGFLPLLQTFVGVADITRLEDFLRMLNIFFHAFPRKFSHAEKGAPYSDWSLN